MTFMWLKITPLSQLPKKSDQKMAPLRSSATRRSAMKMTATAVAAPVVLRAQDTLAQSGTVKVLVWQDYIQPNIAEKFEADTGITLEITTFGSNDEAQSIVRSSNGGDFDVVFPTIDTALNTMDNLPCPCIVPGCFFS